MGGVDAGGAVVRSGGAVGVGGAGGLDVVTFLCAGGCAGAGDILL